MHKCFELQKLSIKKYILNYYKDRLLKYKDIEMNFNYKGNVSGAWMPTVVFNDNSKIRRDKILEAFKKENIDARVFFWPLSSLPMFKSKRSNINAWSISERAINLPSYHELTNKQMDLVIKVIKSLIQKH